MGIVSPVVAPIAEAMFFALSASLLFFAYTVVVSCVFVEALPIVATVYPFAVNPSAVF